VSKETLLDFFEATKNENKTPSQRPSWSTDISLSLEPEEASSLPSISSEVFLDSLKKLMVKGMES
jgi:hypothetical protein